MTTTPDFRALCAELLADLEVEAYAHWVIDPEDYPLFERARAALATPPPKPPSLKEQGLESLDEVILCLKMLIPGAPVDGIHIENIRRALEALPND